MHTQSTHTTAQREDTPSVTPNFDFRGDLRAEAAVFRQQTGQGILIGKTANEWLSEASTMPIPRMLFGEFWAERELTILFAGPGDGKSLLAVQIAQAVASGTPVAGFAMDATAQPVLYFDFELSKKQLEKRYSADYTQHFEFSPQFMRYEINPDGIPPDGMETAIIDATQDAINTTGGRVLIVDNITYLRAHTEQAKDAGPFMKELNALKKRENLSILLIAHTPKRDASRPITRNDLQGSSMLLNFADACFAIGRSATDPAMRYLKQIKARSTELLYNDENVCEMELMKAHNFTGLEFRGYGAERDHLRQASDDDRAALTAQVKELHGQGMSFRAIGQQLNISHMTAKRMAERV